MRRDDWLAERASPGEMEKRGAKSDLRDCAVVADENEPTRTLKRALVYAWSIRGWRYLPISSLTSLEHEGGRVETREKGTLTS